jgi:hypothetical protein
VLPVVDAVGDEGHREDVAVEGEEQSALDHGPGQLELEADGLCVVAPGGDDQDTLNQGQLR